MSYGVNLLLFLICFVAGTVPEWVTNSGRSSEFPESRFITGFGLAPVEGDMSRGYELAKRMSQAALLEKIRLKINSSQKQVLYAGEGRGEGGSSHRSQYWSQVTVWGSMEIWGIETRYFHDQSNGVVFAFCWIGKSELAKTYLLRYRELTASLAYMWNEIKEDVSGDMSRSGELLFECEKRIDSLEECRAILAVCGVEGIKDTAWGKYLDIRRELKLIRELPARDVDALAGKLLRGLGSKLTRGEKVLLFTPRERAQGGGGGGCGTFGLALHNKLQSRFMSYTGVKSLALSTEEYCVSGISSALYRGERYGADWVVTGSYQFLGGKVYCVLSVIDVKDRSLLVSVDGEMSSDSGWVYLEECVGEPQELSLEVWTDRGGGEGDLVLEEGDELAIFVRVNRPCYLLFLQTLGDGTRVVPDLIYHNYFLDHVKTNKAVQLPDIFVVKPPFGEELMQFFVSVTPFSPLQVVSRDIGGERYGVVQGNRSRFRGMGVKGVGDGVASGTIRVITVGEVER